MTRLRLATAAAAAPRRTAPPPARFAGRSGPRRAPAVAAPRERAGDAPTVLSSCDLLCYVVSGRRPAPTPPMLPPPPTRRPRRRRR
jgi:hypothetical protein